MTDVEASHLRPSVPKVRVRGLPILAAGLLLLGACALWWRFGEAVFATSLLNAVIACF